MRIFRAIPAYFGGKQKLVKHIFKYIPKGAKILDAFMGGGSVSLYAKWRGHDIIANDWGFLPRVIGKTLIENYDESIGPWDIREILIWDGEDYGELEERIAEVMPEKHWEIVKQAVVYAWTQKDTTHRWPLLLLAWKYFAYMTPFNGDITNLRTGTEYKQGEFSKFTENDAKMIKKWKENPKERLNRIAQNINKAIFRSIRNAEFWDMDVFEAIQKAGQKGYDTIYLDPPYLGAECYEKRNFLAEWILTGEKPDEPKPSIFNNKNKGLKALEKLAETCKEAGFKRVILSYWTKDITAKQLEEIFKEFNLKQIQINYKYSYGIADRNKGALEFLGVGEA